MASSHRAHPVIESIAVTSLAPDGEETRDPEIARLLPRDGEHPIRVEAVILGINSAIANGIRRVLLSEMSRLVLALESESFETNDPFVMIDMIRPRLALIPLMQSKVRAGDRFELSAENTTDEPLDVMSAQLVRARPGARAFFETFTILTLQPHRTIKFAATVVDGVGRADGAWFNTAFTAIANPLDERPIAHPSTGFPDRPQSEPHLPHNERAKYLQFSTASDPHDYLITFECAGFGADGRAILVRAIDNIIARVERLRSAPCLLGQERQGAGTAVDKSISSDLVGLHVITVPDETDTVGQIFARSAHAMFPNLDFVACDCDDLSRNMTIRIRTGAPEEQLPIAQFVGATIDHALQILRAIRA